MTDVPADWILLEAAKRCGMGESYSLTIARMDYNSGVAFRALCDMIAKHEQPPVDRKLLCAREAISHGSPTLAEAATEREINHCIRAIELWIEGYGE